MTIADTLHDAANDIRDYLGKEDPRAKRDWLTLYIRNVVDIMDALRITLDSECNIAVLREALGIDKWPQKDPRAVNVYKGKPMKRTEEYGALTPEEAIARIHKMRPGEILIVAASRRGLNMRKRFAEAEAEAKRRVNQGTVVSSDKGVA